MKIKPLGDMIILERIKEEPKAGFVLPEEDQGDGKTNKGKVIAVGAGKMTADGIIVKPEVEVGDTVLYSRYSPTKIMDGDKEYLVVREEMILVIIK